MFNQKRMLLFLSHEEKMSFKGKRMAYEGPEKKETGPEAKEKPLTTDEKKEVINDLQTKTLDADYDTTKSPTESFAKLAKKLYPQNAAKEKFATMVLDETFGVGATRTSNNEILDANGCKFVRVEDGRLKFYKSKDFKPGNEIKLTEAGVPIKTPSLEEPKPEAPKGPAAEQILSTEPSPEQKQAIEFFKKAFPHAKPDQIRVSGTETMSVGKKAGVYLGRYIGTEGETPTFYDESGKGQYINSENFEIGKGATAEVQKGMIIEAPKKNGSLGKFVFVKIDAPMIGVGGQKTFMGWIEIGKLRRFDDRNKPIETENAWKKEEYTDEKVKKGDYTALGNTHLFRGKGGNAGDAIRSINKGDKLTVTFDKVRKVGTEEYVFVTLETKGGKDVGWARKEMVIQPTVEALPKEAAYQEKKDERADEEMVAKYYNRETGLIHFDGDKKAENTITIGDLFPNAKAGDKLRIKRKAGGKMMEATYNPDKEYTKYFKDGRKPEKRKGTFVFKNGQRVEIWDGDIILPGWEEEKAAEEPKRAFVRRYPLKPGENYQDVAVEALKNDIIKKAFDGSTFNEPEKVTAYVKLLKQYQQGNTLFFIVPTPAEAGVPSAEEITEAEWAKKEKKYKTKAAQEQASLNRALREDLLKDLGRKTVVRDSLRAILGPYYGKERDDKWRAIWNGDINKEVVGLNKLKAVLQDPIFINAGVTSDNAREKVLGLLIEYKDTEVDLEDIVDYFKIYYKADGSVGSFSELKKEIEELKPYMKDFEAKRDQMLKDTEGFLVIQEKVKLAESQGKDPHAYLTKEDIANYNKTLSLFGSPEYKRIIRISHINSVLDASANLLQAIGELDVKEFKTDTVAMAAEQAKMTPEAKRCVDMMATVFADSGNLEWSKKHGGRNFTWEDVAAGEERKAGQATEFGKYFDPYAPVVRIRSRLNKYTSDKGELDGTERITEKETVVEFNRLMRKALDRLIAWKLNPKAAADFINKYSESKVSLPPKNEGEKDEAYSVRVAPLLTGPAAGAFEKLKVNGFADLQVAEGDSANYKELVRDRYDLIRFGYYCDSRDEEKGLVEGKEGEMQLSMNPQIRAIQEKYLAEGGNKEGTKRIENIFLGGVGVKVDTTKPLKQAIGLGLGTGVDLGDGFTLLIGIGVDSIADHPQPMLGVAIRKGWKLGEEERTEIGVSAGPVIGLNGPSLAGSVDFSFPISSDVDMKIFAGGSVGTLAMGVGGGIGFAKNYDAAHKNLEKEVGGFDPKEIDAEKDPEKKFQMIINNPQIGPYYRFAASKFPKLEDQRMVVLDLYQLHRARISSKAAEQNSAPFISGGGIAAGVAIIGGVPIPFVGPYLTFTVDKTTYIYTEETEESKKRDKTSDDAVRAKIFEEVKKANPGGTVEFKDVKAGESGRVITDRDGNIAIRKNNFQVDIAQFKDNPSIDRYNEALKPYDMKLVPDPSGLLELQVFGALGNLEIYMDPGMEKRGLILRDGKVFLAPGAKPELFITREEFFSPFPKEGYYQQTIITITDTPKRTRTDISHEVAKSGAYLYRKAGKQWEIMGTPSQQSNVMDAAGYEKVKANLETYSEKVEGFDDTQWKAYEARINALPFYKDREPDLTVEKQKELKDFSKKFLARNLLKYKEYTTVKPTDSEEAVNEKRRKLAELIQGDAKKETSKGGLGAELSDLQMNFVMSELMDLSFSELEKAPDKRARFEQNLEWSRKAVLLPFFRKKVKELNERAEKEGRPELKINSTPEQLVDLVVKRLLANVKDEELGKPGQQLGENWMFNSVAGAIGTGLRGVPGYISQDKYGVLGLHEEDLTKPGIEGELARIILELESPLDRTSDKAMMESPLAKKIITMAGMWFVLGDSMANEAVDGMQKALKGETVDPNNKGYQEFKKILLAIRDTQLKGGNSYIYNKADGSSYEFRLTTKVADMAHARCGNASFGVQEDIQIYARVKKSTGFVVAAGKESTAVVNVSEYTRFISFGLAGVVMIDVGKEPTPTPPETKVDTKEEGGVVEGGGEGKGQGSQGGTQGGPVAPPGDSTPPPGGENPPPPTF